VTSPTHNWYETDRSFGAAGVKDMTGEINLAKMVDIDVESIKDAVVEKVVDEKY
jgi:hypothetical protein